MLAPGGHNEFGQGYMRMQTSYRSPDWEVHFDVEANADWDGGEYAGANFNWYWLAEMPVIEYA